MEALTIQPNASSIGRYRKLLVSDWDEGDLESTLGLARSVLARAGLLLRFPWEAPPKVVRKSSPRPYIVPPRASDDLVEYLSRLNDVEERRAQSASLVLGAAWPHEWQLAQAAGFYFLRTSFPRPSMPTISDPTGFYRDILSLAFRQSADLLIPPLLRTSPEQAQFLASAMDAFVRFAWDDNPSHRDTLLAELKDVLGDRDGSLALRESALQSTDPESHEYLTKAQALLFGLADAGRIEEAEIRTLEIARQAPLERLAELRELMRHVYLADLVGRSVHVSLEKKRR